MSMNETIPQSRREYSKKQEQRRNRYHKNVRYFKRVGKNCEDGDLYRWNIFRFGQYETKAMLFNNPKYNKRAGLCGYATRRPAFKRTQKMKYAAKRRRDTQQNAADGLKHYNFHH